MTSVFTTKITKVYNALINRINDSISTHNLNNNAHSTLFNNKEDSSNKVTTLVDNVDNIHFPSTKVLYDFIHNQEDCLELTFTGNTVQPYLSDTTMFNNSDVIIDYGDGTIETNTNILTHTYSDSGTHIIKVYNVSGLSTRAFYGITNLINIKFPQNIIFGEFCFFNCTGLTNIDIENVNVSTLSWGCFRGCTSLKNIILPSKLNYTSGYMFYGCSNLESIVFTNKNLITSGSGYNYDGIPNSCKIYVPAEVLDAYITEANHGYGIIYPSPSTYEYIGYTDKVDNQISNSSNNPVSNKVIKAALDNKADISSIPTGSSTATDIKMNGTQNAGSSTKFAKADHIHPTDTNRAPAEHTHGSITNDGEIGTTANKPIITGTNGVLQAGSFESTATNIKMNGTQAVGSSNNFARSDHVHPVDTSRAPAEHTHSYSTLTNKPTLSSLSTQTGELNIKDVAGLEDYISAGFDIYVVEDFNQSDIEDIGWLAKDGQLGDGFYVFIESESPKTQREFPNGVDSLKENTIYMLCTEDEAYYYEILCYYNNINEDLRCEQLGSTKTELPSIINNLTSTDSTAALSAAQGKALNENKIDTAGTGLSKSGTTLNHSNSVTENTSTTTIYPLSFDENGHITGKGTGRSVTSSRTSGSGALITSGGVYDTTAPKSHVSSATTYGEATASKYGHCKVINNLTQSTYNNGYALSAYQGYVLQQNIDNILQSLIDALDNYG